MAVLQHFNRTARRMQEDFRLDVETELEHALPCEEIKPIYVIKHPAFEADRPNPRLPNV